MQKGNQAGLRNEGLFEGILLRASRSYEIVCRRLVKIVPSGAELYTYVSPHVPTADSKQGLVEQNMSHQLRLKRDIRRCLASAIFSASSPFHHTLQDPGKSRLLSPSFSGNQYDKATKMGLSETFTLNTGARIPAVGFGTWQAAPTEVERAVETALRCGYRHIDCAAIYRNEEEVGRGIQKSGVAREDIFVTTKLWNAAHEPHLVEAALDESLRDLGVEYCDLYLMHWPV